MKNLKEELKQAEVDGNRNQVALIAKKIERAEGNKFFIITFENHHFYNHLIVF